MKKIDSDLHQKFKEEEIPMPNFETMWSSIEKERNKVRTKSPKLNRNLVSVAAAFIILVGSSIVGTSYFVDADQSLMSKLFGTNQELQQIERNATSSDIKALEAKLQLAEHHFSVEDYELFSKYMKQYVNYVKAMTVTKDGIQKQDLNRLTLQEQQQLEELESNLQPYLTKIKEFSSYSKLDIADFSFKKPSFIPEGYTLDNENIVGSKEVGESPVVMYEFTKGEFGYRVAISPILKAEEDEFTLRSFDDIEKSKLKDYDVLYGTNGDSNVTAMKLLSNDYQIFLIADTLTKDEMLNVMNSMIP